MAEGDGNPIEAGQFLGENGAFQADYLDHFPEEMRSNETLRNTKSVQGMAKQLIDSQATIGKLSGGRKFAVLPNEQSTPEEIREHHTTLGCPVDAKGYEFDKLKMPEGQVKDEKFMETMANAMFEAGTSKPAASKIVEGYLGYVDGLAKQMAADDKQANTKADAEIHSLLGSAYPETMKKINTAIEALVRPIDSQYADDLIAEVKFDPVAMKLFKKISEMTGEDNVPLGGDGGGGFTPADAQAKIDDIMHNNPYYLTSSPAGKPQNPKYHKELVAEVNGLFKMIADAQS